MPADFEDRRRPEYPPGQVPPRFQQGPLTTALELGPLAFLHGSWRGPGFNAIWRPDNPQSLPLTSPPNQTKRLLELNLTNDSFHFQVIPGVVPNRGLNPQPDLSLYGLHYLQRTSDADPKPSKHVHPHGYSTTAGQALHIEPGLFMNVPAALAQTPGSPSMPLTLPPGTENTIVRMGSIPHGVTVLMQGPNPGNKPKHGKPHIPHLRPFSTPGNVYPGLTPVVFPGPYVGPPLPPGTPNPPGVGIQPINQNAVVGPPPLPPGSQHVVPEININVDVLVPNQPLGPLPPPLPAASPLSYQSTGPYPEHFQHFIDDPNSVLRDAIEDQDILGFIEINLTTDSLSTTGIPTLGVGSLFETVSNIPFLGTANREPPNPLPGQPATVAIQKNSTANAFVYSASATFWIEWVRDRDRPPIPLHEGPGEPCWPVTELEPYWRHSTHLQLQYSQLVILIFNNVLWPHVTVATMTLSDG
jgi:hypothetical protein